MAAHFFSEKGVLKAIVLPRGLPVCFRGGTIYFLSRACITFYRYIHVFLRWLKFKRSKTYLSLLEFIKENPNISIFRVTPQKFALEQLTCFKNIDDEGSKEYIIFSCIFPFKIPADAFPVRRMVNIHPGILPENRGPNPYFWTLVNKKEFSGITYHVLTSEIDAGPILLREIFPINSNFSEYKLEKTTVEHLKHSLPIFFGKLEQLWPEAASQENGIYYPHPSFKDRKRHMRYSTFYMKDFFVNK